MINKKNDKFLMSFGKMPIANNFLNKGGWKIFYLLILLKLFIFYGYIRFFKKGVLTFNYDFISNTYEKQKKSYNWNFTNNAFYRFLYVYFIKMASKI